MGISNSKIDFKKAIGYIIQNGGELEIRRLNHFLKRADSSEIEKFLSKYQYSNGGWYYEEDEKKIVSIGASTLWLRILLELELNDTPIVARTAKFLVENQEHDGSWYELKEKLEKSPQIWLSSDLMDNRLWFTISTTVFLIGCSFESHPAIKKSTHYLQNWWDEHKSFRHTWYPYWAGLAFFGFSKGIKSEEFSSCYSYTITKMNQYDGFHLGWILTMCRLGKISSSNPLVETIFNQLKNLQNSDGSWTSTYGNAYCTMFILDLSKSFGFFSMEK